MNKPLFIKPDYSPAIHISCCWIALTLAVIVACIATILYLNDGFFSYSLDDPYIHLALAQRILEGHYGLNAHEASPASSIAYPFLIAILLKLGIGQWAALALNVAATAMTVIFIVLLASEANLDLICYGTARLLILAVITLLGLNLIGLALTGLEHSLHTACTLAAFLGVAQTLRTGKMPQWLPTALVLNPLIRFEGISILFSGCLILWLEKNASKLFLRLPLACFLLVHFVYISII